MRIIFTTDDSNVAVRSRYLRGGLIRIHHNVSKIKHTALSKHIQKEGVWFHGLSGSNGIPINPLIVKGLDQWRGKIVFFQNDDGMDFGYEKIPSCFINRASLFLRNHWPSDRKTIPEILHDKIGFINPLLKPGRAVRGNSLCDRKTIVSFIGAATGISENGRENSRIKTIRLLKKHRIPFNGGIVFHKDYQYEEAREFYVDKLSPQTYFNLLSDTQICLAIHGNCPLTYRLFEGLSRRCLVIAQDLGEISFISGGLIEGTHYVKVRKDLSDLIETISYYIKHQDEAQKIADTGFQFYKQRLEFSGVQLPKVLIDEITAGWNQLLTPAKPTPYSVLVSLFLPMIHSL